MTEYLNLLVKIREDLTKELNDELDDIVSEAENELLIYIIVLVIIIAICLIVALWFVHFFPFLEQQIPFIRCEKNSCNCKSHLKM